MIGKYLNLLFSRGIKGDKVKKIIIGSVLFFSGVFVLIGGYIIEALYNIAIAVYDNRSPDLRPEWNDIPPFAFFLSLLLIITGIFIGKGEIEEEERKTDFKNYL